MFNYSCPLYAKWDHNDTETLIALANSDFVQIMSVIPNQHTEITRIYRQKNYFSSENKQYQDILPRLPAMSWGFGHSPILKDKMYSILAIGWGPLI